MTSDYPQSTHWHSACPRPALLVLNIFFYILSRLIFFNYMGSGQWAVISFGKPRPFSPQLSPSAMSKNTKALQNCMGKSSQWSITRAALTKRPQQHQLVHEEEQNPSRHPCFKAVPSTLTRKAISSSSLSCKQGHKIRDLLMI